MALQAHASSLDSSSPCPCFFRAESMYRQDSPLSFDEDTSSWYLEQTPAGSKDLCDRCEEVLSLAASDSTSKASVHHQSAGSFFKAADGSCLICSYLYGKIPWKAECFPAEILEAIVPGAPFSTYSVYRTRLEIRLEWLGESYDPGKGLIWSLPYPLNRNAPPSFVSDRPTYNLDFQVSDCRLLQALQPENRLTKSQANARTLSATPSPPPSASRRGSRRSSLGLVNVMASIRYVVPSKALLATSLRDYWT